MHGLGVGGSRVLQPLGMDPERPFTALRETFELNRRLLAGETVGEASLPWFRPDEPLPIAVAGRGPRVQRLAAEHSDCVILSAAPPADLPAFAERIRASGSAEIAWSAYLAYNDTERRRVLPHFSYMAVDAPAEVREADGLDDATTAEVRRLMLAGRMDKAAELLPDALVDRYGVAGTPAEVSARIGELRDCFDIFMLPMNDEATAADHIRAKAPRSSTPPRPRPPSADFSVAFCASSTQDQAEISSADFSVAFCASSTQDQAEIQPAWGRVPRGRGVATGPGDRQWGEAPSVGRSPATGPAGRDGPLSLRNS